MLRTFWRRLFFGALVLWGITLITFTLSHIVPGDPAILLAGSHASASALANVRREYGLDLSLPQQYWLYLDGIAHGQLGYAFVTRQSVMSALGTYLPASIELAMFALVVGTVAGIGVGVWSAQRRGSPTAVGGQLLAGVGLSVPTFWVALLLQIIFYHRLHWLPGSGRVSPDVNPPPTVTHFYFFDSLLAGQWSTFVNVLEHLILPGLSLTLGVVGMTARIVRTSMLEVLSEDYMRTAVAKGLKPSRIFFRHSLRNALLPVVTILGLEFAWLAGGVFLVENIFSWPGVGRFAIQAIQGEDYNSIMGVTLAIAALYVAVNFVVDLAYMFLDPRIRLG